jgi:hypothetical protein
LIWCDGCFLGRSWDETSLKKGELKLLSNVQEAVARSVPRCQHIKKEFERLAQIKSRQGDRETFKTRGLQIGLKIDVLSSANRSHGLNVSLRSELAAGQCAMHNGSTMGANVLAHAWKSRTQSRVEFSKWAWIEVVGGTIVV